MSNAYEASAPGRLDVLGGIADYAGSAVLQLPIKERTYVSLVWRDDERITLTTTLDATQEKQRSIEIKVEALARLNNSDLPSWSLYVLGCIAIGSADGLFMVRGMDLQVRSDVPVGAGLSSSAALTVATWRVLAEAFSLRLAPKQLARLAQRVEHEIVGAPCGLMDQLAVHCGDTGELIPIRCRPDQIGQPFEVPPGWRFWAVDSGVRHSVQSDEAYGTARAATFMGLQILHRDHGFSGRYLTEMAATGPQYEVLSAKQRVLEELPKEMTGKEFTARYGGLEDQLSRVVPERSYPVQAATIFPIHEHERNIMMVAALVRLQQTPDITVRHPMNVDALEQCGMAMSIAHMGYGLLGLGHPATDKIVAQVRALGIAHGLHGARITGGGSGGSVAVLGDERSDGLDLASVLGVPAHRVIRVYP